MKTIVIINSVRANNDAHVWAWRTHMFCAAIGRVTWPHTLRVRFEAK